MYKTNLFGADDDGDCFFCDLGLFPTWEELALHMFNTTDPVQIYHTILCYICFAIVGYAAWKYYELGEKDDKATSGSDNVSANTNGNRDQAGLASPVVGPLPPQLLRFPRMRPHVFGLRPRIDDGDEDMDEDSDDDDDDGGSHRPKKRKVDRENKPDDKTTPRWKHDSKRQRPTGLVPTGSLDASPSSASDSHTPAGSPRTTLSPFSSQDSKTKPTASTSAPHHSSPLSHVETPESSDVPVRGIMDLERSTPAPKPAVSSFLDGSGDSGGGRKRLRRE